MVSWRAREPNERERRVSAVDMALGTGLPKDEQSVHSGTPIPAQNVTLSSVFCAHPGTYPIRPQHARVRGRIV